MQRALMVLMHTEMNKPVAEVARLCKVGPRTVKRWLGRYASTSKVKDAGRTGRPRVLRPEGLRRAIQLLGCNKFHSASEVAEVLYREGLAPYVLSRTALVRAAKQESKRLGWPTLLYRRGRPKRRLSEDDKKKRVEFCKAHLHTRWELVMFTDRKNFKFKYPGEQLKLGTWGFAGEKLEAGSVNHPKGYNIYAGCTRYGVTTGRAVAGTYGLKSVYTNKKGNQARGISHNEYSDVLRLTFLPQGARIFNIQSIGTWTLQQDNDSSHSIAEQVLHSYNAQHGTSIQLMHGWPPNSPDLSPIENIWSIVDDRVAAKGCPTFGEFCKEVDAELKAVTREALASLWNSMPKRMRKCIELQGGRTSY